MAQSKFARWAALLSALALIAAACTVAAPTETATPAAPATDAPATDAPATDAPATDAPATDAPATAAPEPGGEPTSIKLWRYFNECASQFEGVTEITDTADVCAIQQILANSWNAANPDVQVETTSLVWPGIVELNAALAAGTPPELFTLHAFRIPGYASRGILTPLTAYFEEAGIDVNDMLPSVREAVTYNNEIYALPFDIHGILWHLNLDLWEQAGLVDESGQPIIPVGRAEFEEACQKVQEATGSPIFGAGDDDVAATAWIWYTLLNQAGGSAVDADGLPNVNTPESIEALNTQIALRSANCIGSGELGSTFEGFVNGDVASTVGGTWMVNEWEAQVNDPNAPLKNYYVAPLPQIGPQPANWAGSHTYVVPLGANADPDRVRAAVRYLKYFWDRNLDWTLTGHATVRQSIADSAEYQSLPHRGEYLGFGDSAVYNPSTAWSVGFDQIMHEEVQAALLGQKTPEQALADAQARLMDVATFQ
jgi:multiple sugar transport system substrate-binding protein